MINYPIIVLKPSKEVSLLRRHPWIFSGAIASNTSGLKDGDIVRVLSSKKEYLATGHFQIGSIAVRILTFSDEYIDEVFWHRKINDAIDVRNRIGMLHHSDTNVFRLVHGEGDELPGLIIDYYNGSAVIQFHSAGMYLAKQQIADALTQCMGTALHTIYDKSSQTVPFKAGLNAVDGYLMGNMRTNQVKEYGLNFHIDWESGQKTGFFIDQRENRKLLEKYSKDKAVLNMFAYTGGFSVYAMNGQASMVDTVDSSQKAIEIANKNISDNFGNDSRHTSYVCDAFEYMNDIRDKYDLMILDPPAFAKHNDSLNNALQAYKRLNAKAITQIKSGGIIFTFSCSQVVSKLDFRKSVFAAAAQSKRKVSILHQLTQPADHPVSIFHPEGEYLKGLVLMVD